MPLATGRVISDGSASVLRFSRAGGGAWPEWDRYLEIDHRRAYHIGNICDTCGFFFQRLDGANRSVTIRAIADLLAKGISAVEDALLDTLAPHLPAGPYIAALFDLQLRLTRPGDAQDYFVKDQVDLWGVDTFWGLPHNPRTEYYRAPDITITASTALYQFVVPMHPRGWLDEARVQSYGERIVAGEHPTALALTVLEAKRPADWEGDKAITEHWALAHYLLDGHHKAYAAVTNGRPLRVLSLIAREQGISTGEQVDAVLDHLDQAAAQPGDGAVGR